VARLEGKVAVITGSSMGIGLAIAERFSAEGASVVVNSRIRERAEQAAERLRATGAKVAALAADVARPEEMEALANFAVERFGGLDIWVNNAGINAIGPSVSLDPQAFLRVLEVNLAGVFYGSQAAARQMLARRSGVILQIGSIFGEVGMPMRAAYSSAKHGVLGLTKVLASEWAREGVRVVALDPAYIRTAMDVADQETGDYSDADVERRTPMGRYGTVEEVANAALFLVSDEASYITGVHLTVDGGWVAYGGW
jgi:3-oxoacyl-[acyl-carrier protein] reductase